MPTKTTTKKAPAKRTRVKSTADKAAAKKVKKPAPAPAPTKDNTPSTYTADLTRIATLTPGRFRKLRDYTALDGAKNALFKIRHRREGVEVPPGRWDFDIRKDLDADTSSLWVCYSPLEGDEVQVWWRRFGVWIDHVNPEESAAKSRAGRTLGVQ